MYRAGKWAKLPGDALVPGDLVSVNRPGEGPLLIRGGFTAAIADAGSVVV